MQEILHPPRVSPRSANGASDAAPPRASTNRHAPHPRRARLRESLEVHQLVELILVEPDPKAVEPARLIRGYGDVSRIQRLY